MSYISQCQADPGETRRPNLFLLLAAAGLLAVRIGFCLSLPGPWYLPDEVKYLKHTRMIVSSGEVFYQPAEGGGQPGWPVLLSPFVALMGGEPYPSYLAGIILSSVLATALVFPVYGLARHWLPRTQSAVIALLVGVMPGGCLYGWTLLTEPLYTLLVACCAACFVRAALAGRGRDFAAAGLLAALAYWVRPFGAGCVLACVAGAATWGVIQKRWREPLYALLAAGLVLAGGFAWKAVLQSGQATFTNYPHESDSLAGWAAILLTPAKWGGLALAFIRLLDYLLVASFGIFIPLSLIGAALAIRHFRALSARTKPLVVGVLVLFACTFAVNALAEMSKTELERMYGRYAEPLLPLILVIGAVTWHHVGNRQQTRRNTLILAMGLVVALALTLPQGLISFSNNPGFFYWNLICRHAGILAGLAILPAIGALLIILKPERWWLGAMMLFVLACASTVLVAIHLTDYNYHTTSVRDLAHHAAEAVRSVKQTSSPHPVLWVDPHLLVGQPEVSAQRHHFAWLIQFDLPAVDVRWAREDEVAAEGDFVLTGACAPDMPCLWREHKLSIYRITRQKGNPTP